MMKYFLFIVFSLVYIQTTGQYLNSQNVIPPSPDIASFAKNIDIPMSLSSGVPGINIPIAAVESGAVQIPVSLTYNASGIRVEETPTWVGLGFNLNAGGTITRIVRGLPDEITYGYINAAPNRKVSYVKGLPFLSSERGQVEVDLSNHQVDLEPDIFNFSIMGYSGQFYWDQDSSKFILTPSQNIKLEINGSLASLKFTLPNGVQCFFGENISAIEEITSSETTTRVDGVSYINIIADSDAPYKTSWRITRIVSTTGKEITFEYDREPITEYGRAGETDDFETKTAAFFKRTILQPFLTSITGENCKVIFGRSSASRQDVLDSRKSLDSIIIKNKQGVEIKKFLFSYDYFESSTNPLLWGIAIPFEAVAGKRLYLKSLKEGNGQTFHAPYEFSYHSPSLPDRVSTEQDYWGYYNGKNNPTNGVLALMPRRFIIPGLGLPGMPPQMPQGFTEGADRRVDLNYAKAGSLQFIKYPTGGSIEYIYEENKVQRIYYNSAAGFVPPDYSDRYFAFMPLIPAYPPYATSYSDTFRVKHPLSTVQVIPNLPSPCSEESSQSCRYTITIKSLTDLNFSHIIFNTTPFFYIDLPTGLYSIEATVTGDPDDPPDFIVQLKWGEAEDNLSMKTGGLRLRKAILKDGIGNTIEKLYEYNFPNSNNSSGILAGCPVNVLIKNDSLGNYLGIDKIISNGFIPLTTDGQTARYQFVSELVLSTTGNLKTEHWFNYDISGVILGGLTTGEPQTLRSWRNNSVKRKITYNNIETNYSLATDEWHEYQLSQPFEKTVGLYGPRLVPYNIASEWYFPVSDSTVQYSQTGEGYLKKADSYYYNDLHLLNRKKSTSSNGTVFEEKIWYPSDYNNNTEFNIETLQTNFNISLPIKKEYSKNGKIVNGVITKYNPYGKPTEYYKYEGVRLADTIVHNRNTILETGYLLKQTIDYHGENPVELNEVGSLVSSYIWGYNQNYPIAVVQNANRDQTAYTSFETSINEGQWEYNFFGVSSQGAVTGHLVFNLGNGGITKNNLSASKEYILSYWLKTGGNCTVQGAVINKQSTGNTIGGFTHHELVITGASNISISGTGYIDELRIYPVDARMVTYTYDPLIGKTGECDGNNKITYYEYDELGRLVFIRNEDKSLLKRISYNYAGQHQEDFEYKPASWQATGNYRCIKDGSDNNTGMQEKEEKDLEVESATYNQLRWVSNGQNLTGCPLPYTCTTSNCTGVINKCINNVCETGVLTCETAVIVGGKYRITYYFKWSNGSSLFSHEEISTLPCLPMIF